MLSKLKVTRKLIKIPKKLITAQLQLQKSLYNFIPPIIKKDSEIQKIKTYNKNSENDLTNEYSKIKSVDDLLNYIKRKDIYLLLFYIKKSSLKYQKFDPCKVTQNDPIYNEIFLSFYKKILKEELKSFDNIQILNILLIVKTDAYKSFSNEEINILLQKIFNFYLTKDLNDLDNFITVIKIIQWSISKFKKYFHDYFFLKKLDDKLKKIFFKEFSKDDYIKLLDLNNNDPKFLGELFYFLKSSLNKDKEKVKFIINLTIQNLEKTFDFEATNLSSVTTILSGFSKFATINNYSLKQKDFFSNLILKSNTTFGMLNYKQFIILKENLVSLDIYPYQTDFISFSLEDFVNKIRVFQNIDQIRYNFKIFELYVEFNHYHHRRTWINRLMTNFLKDININNGEEEHDYHTKYHRLQDVIPLFILILKNSAKDFYSFLNYFLIFINYNFHDSLRNLEIFDVFNKYLGNVLEEKVVYLSNSFSLSRKFADQNFDHDDFKDFIKNFNIYFFEVYKFLLKNISSVNDMNNFLEPYLKFSRFLNNEKLKSLNNKLLEGILKFLKKKSFHGNDNFKIFLNISKFVVIVKNQNSSFIPEIKKLLKEYYEVQFDNNINNIPNEIKMEFFYLISQIFENYNNKYFEKLDNYFKNFLQDKFKKSFERIEKIETEEKVVTKYNLGKSYFKNYEKIIITANFFNQMENLIEKKNFIKIFEKKTKLFGIENLKTINILLKFPGNEKIILNLLENLITIFQIKPFTTKIEKNLDIYYKWENKELKNKKKKLLKKLLKKEKKKKKKKGYLFIEDKNSKIALSLILCVNLKNENNYKQFLYLFNITGYENEEYLNFLYEFLNKKYFEDENFKKFCEDLSISQICSLPLKFIRDKENIFSKFVNFKNSDDILNTKNDLHIKIFYYLKNNNLFIKKFMLLFLDQLEIMKKNDKSNFLVILESLFDFDLNLNNFPEIIICFLENSEKISDEIKLKFIYNYFLQNSSENKKLNIYYEKLEKISRDIIIKKDFYEFITYNPNMNILINNSFTKNFEIIEEKLNLNKTLINSSSSKNLKNEKDFVITLFDYQKTDKKNYRRILIRNFYWQKYKVLLYEQNDNLPNHLDTFENEMLKNYSKNLTTNKYLNVYYHKIFSIKSNNKFYLPYYKNLLFVSDFKDFYYSINENDKNFTFDEEDGNSLIHFKKLIENDKDDNYEFWKFEDLGDRIKIVFGGILMENDGEFPNKLKY